MENSIEKIWKEGFMKNDALVAPKLNDLYNQKSKNIVDKLKRMFEVNLTAIIAGAVILLAVSFFIGTPYAGAALFLQLVALVIVGKKEVNRLNKIDKGENSYQYLKAFDTWMKGVISIYTKIYRLLYPGIFLTFVIGIWFSSFGEPLRNKFIMNFPDAYMVLGMPVVGLLAAILLAVLVGVFAGKLYKLDMNLVYGREFQKLDEIIADMEELRS